MISQVTESKEDTDPFDQENDEDEFQEPVDEDELEGLALGLHKAGLFKIILSGVDEDDEDEVKEKYMELLEGITQADLKCNEGIDFAKGYNPNSIKDKISFINSLPTDSKD